MALAGFPIVSLYTASNDEYGKFFVIKMKAQDLPDDLPYYPNARMPSLAGNVAKSILETLKNQPESFYTKNAGGIHIVAENVYCRNQGKGQVLHADFRLPDPSKKFPGHGILDGGHTYACIQHLKQRGLLSEKVEVSVTLLYEIKDDEIAAISLARNTRKNVGSVSRYNLVGTFDPLKQSLPVLVVDNIQWKENSPGAIKSPFCHATHLIKMISCLNTREFPVLMPKYPNSALSSGDAKSLLNSIETCSFLIKDALELEKLFYGYINKHYFRKKGLHGIAGFGKGRSKSKVVLADGTTFDFCCSVKAIYPILFGIRTLLDEDMNWIIPYKIAWEERGRQMVTLLIESLRRAEENNSSMESVFRTSFKVYEEMSLLMQRYLYETAKATHLKRSA